MLASLNIFLRKNLTNRNFLSSSLNSKALVEENKKKAKLEDTILTKIKQKCGYNFIHAEINNLSWKFDKPEGAETHFELTVVAIDFESMKKEQRLKFVQSIIDDEIKKLETITFRLLTPSKWYDSNQRGLKLIEVTGKPPVLNGDLKKIAKEFYENKKT